MIVSVDTQAEDLPWLFQAVDDLADDLHVGTLEFTRCPLGSRSAFREEQGDICPNQIGPIGRSGVA